MSPPPAQEPWIILAAIPKVVGYKEAKRIFPPGADISVVRNRVPRASVLTVPPHISLPPCLGAYPYVVTADRSGLLLLLGTHPVNTNSVVVSHHICDARTGEVVTLPELPPMRQMSFYGAANVGLIMKDDDGCMVAELQPRRDSTGSVILRNYKVGGECCDWRERELTCSPPLTRDWYPEGVVSHGGMLWWVDLSYGLLAGDPFAEEPNLLHVPLPQVPDQLRPDVYDRGGRGAHRCVKVSGGRLMYVQIHGDPNVPVVSTWMLAESILSPGEWDWHRHRSSVPLAEVWIHQSYVDTTLPLSIPTLALLHPTDPDRLYFFLQSHIFAVDLRLRKLVAFNQFRMPEPPCQHRLKRTSHFVHAWHYDPSSSRMYL
uniref:DUF1618 domain-containing protein n=1 Tax=Oryza brachyantha TaxID=4533 RepID=J3LNH7_ORYBR